MEQKSEDFLKEENYQYRVKSVYGINKLLSDSLMKSYSIPNPENEYRLENYVLELINHQDTDEIKLHILLKTTAIDPFNERRNFWIIKQVIGIACYHRYFVQDFLHQLKTYIPHSSFLWIFLQYSDELFTKEKWIELFEAYNQKKIEEIREEIDFNYVLKSLPYTPKLKQICLYYAKGEYITALGACEELYNSEALYKKKDAKEESVIVNRIALNLIAIASSSHKSVPKWCIGAAMNQFSNGYHENLIRLVADIVSNPQERKRYTADEWNLLYSMLARSYEQTGFINQSLKLYETVFLRVINSSEGNNYGQIKLIFDAIVRLKSKVNFNLYRTNLFEENNNPLILYTHGLALIEKGKYSDAIRIIDRALAFYIPKTGLNSAECIKCYFALASSFNKLKKIDNATIQSSMAFALASTIYEENQPELLVIEKQLRQFELALSIKQYGEFSSECMDAYNNLGRVYEKEGSKQEALDAYEKAYTIYTENFSDESQDQELLTTLDQLKLSSSLK